MVDIIKPHYRPPSISSSANKVPASSQVETHNDSSAGQPYVVTRDRRRVRDRRQNKNGVRPIYEMRSGRGRRKEDGRPSIDTRV